MTLEQPRVFVAVAERQHVTRAAEALNIAQSAVSASIGALEGRHGAKLFNRVGRRIELTEAGALFLAEARAVLARAESAGLVLSELGDLKRGVLSVHASQTIAGYWLPRHLVAFRRSHPGVAIRLSIENTNQAAAVVRGGEADLGFDEGEVDDPALISETVARDQLVIVIGAEHSWGEAKGLGKMDLLDVDWVLREPGSGTRSGFEHALGALSLSLHELRSRSSCPPMKRCAPRSKQAWGAAVMSASVAAPSIEAGLLRQVDFALPERCYYALRHAERYRSRGSEALMDIIRRVPALATKSHNSS
jgi:DNA-binding transcriptional LysR family regulator